MSKITMKSREEMREAGNGKEIRLGQGAVRDVSDEQGTGRPAINVNECHG